MTYFLLSIIVIAINLALLVLIILSQSRGKLFAITLFGAIIWASSLNILYSELMEDLIKYDINLFLVRISFLGAIITVTGLVLFERVYLRGKLWNPILYWLIISILGCVFILTPVIVKQVITIDINRYRFEYGFLYSVYGVTYLGLFLYAYIRILHRFFTTTRKVEKSQLRFFVIGISLSFWIGLFTNLIYPAIFGSSDLSKFGPLGMVFVGIFTTYAIFKHHLFNIKMIKIKS
jgi:hypothetical protein